MTVRDAGMIALGFLAGMLVTSVSMVAAARDIETTDKMMRGLAMRFNGRVKGQG